MIDFISSVISGVTANGVTRLIEALWGGNKAHNIKPDNHEPDDGQTSPESQMKKQFQNFHIKSGFETILNSVEQPVVHFIVESKPTTAWHLVTIVVESKLTGQWYVSKRGEMAFEGSGGGLHVANRVIETCRERKVANVAWVLPQHLTKELSSGFLLWGDVKSQLIPLMSYSGSEYFVDYIAKKYSEVNK